MCQICREEALIVLRVKRFYVEQLWQVIVGLAGSYYSGSDRTVPRNRHKPYHREI